MNYLFERFGDDAQLFNLEKQGIQNKIYECALNVDDILSNYAVTFILENNCLVGYDNTNDINIVDVKQTVEEFYNEVDLNCLPEMYDTMYKELSASIEGEINLFEQYLYYDVTTECIYIAYNYQATDNEGFEFADQIMRLWE